jgi:hypothetical protein
VRVNAPTRTRTTPRSGPAAVRAHGMHYGSEEDNGEKITSDLSKT